MLCTDMEAEKRYLSDHAYPELRQFCQQHGLDFQIVDIPMETDLDNQTGFHYKMKQMQKCNHDSTGPTFVVESQPDYFCATQDQTKYSVHCVPSPF